MAGRPTSEQGERGGGRGAPRAGAVHWPAARLPVGRARLEPSLEVAKELEVEGMGEGGGMGGRGAAVTGSDSGTAAVDPSLFFLARCVLAFEQSNLTLQLHLGGASTTGRL